MITPCVCVCVCEHVCVPACVCVCMCWTFMPVKQYAIILSCNIICLTEKRFHEVLSYMGFHIHTHTHGVCVHVYMCVCAFMHITMKQGCMCVFVCI
jgi:hypothetical protein